MKMKMEEPRKRPLKRQDSIDGKYKTQERIQERNVSNETKFGLEEDELNKTLIVTNAFPPRRKMFWLVWIKRNLQEKIIQELEGYRRMKDYARTRRIQKNESFFKNLKDLDERKIMQELERLQEWKNLQESEGSRRMKVFSRTRRIQKNERICKNLKDQEEWKIIQELEGSEEWKINQEKFMSTRTPGFKFSDKRRGKRWKSLSSNKFDIKNQWRIVKLCQIMIEIFQIQSVKKLLCKPTERQWRLLIIDKKNSNLRYWRRRQIETLSSWKLWSDNPS